MVDSNYEAFMAKMPPFTKDPVDRLKHTITAFANQPEDEWVVIASSDGKGYKTGLTWGDLRSLDQFIDDWYEADVVESP